MPPEISSVDADRLLASPGRKPARRGVRIEISDGAIAGVDENGTPADVGGPGTLVIPGLANAHDHGRGLRRLAFGGVDDALECWMVSTFALHPKVDPYVTAAVAFSRLAMAGVTSVVHCHSNVFLDLKTEAIETCRAARDVGIRIAFVVPMRDRNYLVYEGDNTILEDLTAADSEAVRERLYKVSPPPADQVALVGELAELCESELISVQFGPYGVEWTTDELRELVAEDSADSGRRIHIHCQETKLQREWIDARYPGGFVSHLDDIGFLSDRLTIAHGVWLTPQECERMAERGVIVSINTSSNLRLRSGIAPVAQFIETGMPMGLGMDTLALDDDDDALRELRLTYRLHAGTSFDEVLTPDRLFEASMCTGARAVTGRGDFGTIAPGRPADLVVLDYQRMAADVIDDASSELDVLLVRATKDYVRSVIVNGREIVRDGMPTGVDYPALRAELAAQAANASGEIGAFQPILRRYQDAIRAYFREGRHKQVANRLSGQPFSAAATASPSPPSSGRPSPQRPHRSSCD